MEYKKGDTLAVVAHAFNPRTQAEGRQISEFQDSQRYGEQPCKRVLLAYSLRVQSTMAGKVWQQLLWEPAPPYISANQEAEREML